MTKVLLLPLVPKGGFHGTPPEKTTFPPEFYNEILHHICTGHKNHNCAKKNLKCCTVSKWRPNNRFLFRIISILAKFWKNPFPKRIFQWNLAQRRRIWIDLYYWNKNFKKIIPFQNGGRNNFLILRNNANLC